MTNTPEVIIVEAEREQPVNWLEWFIALVAVALVGWALTPNVPRARSRNALVGCKSNLKNIGTALEMYSTDCDGHYPDSLSKLTPNYLKTVPTCRVTNDSQYAYQTTTAYNTGGFTDYYFVYCTGGNHDRYKLSGYPQYDGIQGLIER